MTAPSLSLEDKVEYLYQKAVKGEESDIQDLEGFITACGLAIAWFRHYTAICNKDECGECANIRALVSEMMRNIPTQYADIFTRAHKCLDNIKEESDETNCKPN